MDSGANVFPSSFATNDSDRSKRGRFDAHRRDDRYDRRRAYRVYMYVLSPLHLPIVRTELL